MKAYTFFRCGLPDGFQEVGTLKVLPEEAAAIAKTLVRHDSLIQVWEGHPNERSSRCFGHASVFGIQFQRF